MDSLHLQRRCLAPVAYLHSFLMTFLIFVALAMPASAGWVRPVEGGGSFLVVVDAVNRWQPDGSLDVLVFVAVANSELHFEPAGSRQQAKLGLEVVLTGPDGQQVSKKRQMRTPLIDEQDILTGTLFQNFGLILKDVPFNSGRLVCRVVDVNRILPTTKSYLAKKLATSEAVADWYAADSARPDVAVGVGDPLFLAHAPLRSWNPNQLHEAQGQPGFMQDFVHPARRYGLEQDHLQVYLPIWPSDGVTQDQDIPAGLLVQIVSSDQKFAVTDTTLFDETGRALLAQGNPAGLVYELDVNLLPEGSYQLSVAPLGGRGRGLVSGFDVAWSLTAIGRHREMILGEGRMVFDGPEEAVFLAASAPEQERLLNEFWESLNPDPEDPVNEVYLEFQYRVAYVKRFLGGFGARGAADSRGEIFILLGPPNEVERNAMPMNSTDQDDARVKVYKSNAPDRPGTWAKDESLPMPHSYNAAKEIAVKQTSPTRYFGFELWRYKGGGRELFANAYSAGGLEKRFLFVDQTGAGEYTLESSNVFTAEE